MTGKTAVAFTVILVLLSVLAGCSAPSVQPDMKNWNPDSFPEDTGWVSPPKTWISNYSPGTVREQTVLLHSPRTYTTTKIVSTVDGDNGILEQHLDVQPYGDSLTDADFSWVSRHPGDRIKIDSYDPETQTIVLSGFDPVELDRIVQFTYIPDYFTYVLYWGMPFGSDSGRELSDPPTFVGVEDSVDWVAFTYNGQTSKKYILIDVPPMTTAETVVTLSVPDGVSLPDNWEFRIGSSETTGREFELGVSVSVEINYKFLVSNNELKLLEETED